MYDCCAFSWRVFLFLVFYSIYPAIPRSALILKKLFFHLFCQNVPLSLSSNEVVNGHVLVIMDCTTPTESFYHLIIAVICDRLRGYQPYVGKMTPTESFYHLIIAIICDHLRGFQPYVGKMYFV